MKKAMNKISPAFCGFSMVSDKIVEIRPFSANGRILHIAEIK